MVDAVIDEDLQVRGHLRADRPGRRRMHKDTTQSEHHERIQNLMEASEIAITNHLTESAVKKGVRPGAEFHKLHPGQAKPSAPLCLGDSAKTGVWTFQWTRRRGVGLVTNTLAA